MGLEFLRLVAPLKCASHNMMTFHRIFIVVVASMEFLLAGCGDDNGENQLTFELACCWQLGTWGSREQLPTIQYKIKRARHGGA